MTGERRRDLGAHHGKSEFLYGIHPVTEAVAAGRRRPEEIYISRSDRSGPFNRLLALAESHAIRVRTASPSHIGSLTGVAAHQGVAARVGPYPLAKIQDLTNLPGENETAPSILILDGIQDPQNLGAMVRTSLCTGVSGVIIPKDRSARPTPAVSKASAGALEHVCLVQVTNLVRAIQALKDEGFWILGLDPASKVPVYAGRLCTSVGMVIGGENKGIRRLVRLHCDQMVAVPQTGPVHSLNASAAAAMLMYESLRQRNAARKGGSRPPH